MVPNNMMQLVQMIRSGQNPYDVMSQLIQQAPLNSTMSQNLLNMTKNHDGKGIEALARNFMKSQGKDFDKEFASFKQMMGLK